YAASNILLGLVGRGIAFLDLEGDLVGTAGLGPPQGTNGARNGRVDVRTCPRNGAGGEGRGVEFVLRVEIERRVHGPFPARGGCLAVQQMQEVRTDRVVVGLDLDAATILRVMVPIKQHGA